MSLTLAQAKPFVGPYVSGGQCQNSSEAVVKINEAAARLWALGDWVGTIQRWAVTVDDDGVFTVPADVYDTRRIAVLGEGIPHTPAGSMFMDDAYSLVFDSAGVLPVRQIGPGRFKVIGVIPDAVDIMCKARVKYASTETDILAIDDVYALKLAVQAIFNEESDQHQMSDALWEKAVAHLKSKTDGAVLAARRTKFTTVLSGAAQNTVGYARAKFAMATSDGLAVDDHKSISLINDAEEVLIPMTTPYVEGLFKTTSGILSLPPHMSSIYRIAIDNCPATLRSNWFEFVQSGLGYRESTRKNNRGESVIPRGESALHTDLPEPTKLSFLSQGDDRGVKVTITGVGVGGSYLTETITINAGDFIETANTYYDVKSITKDPSVSDILVIASGGIEVAYLYAWQQDSTVKRYYIPSYASCKEQIIRVIAKPRFFPKTSDFQRLQVPYPYAVSLMAQGILLQRGGKIEEANALKSEAITYLETSMANEKIGEANVIDMQNKGFGFGGLTSRR